MGVVCGRGSGRERPAGWGWGALGWRSRSHALAPALGGTTTFVHAGGLGSCSYPSICVPTRDAGSI